MSAEIGQENLVDPVLLAVGGKNPKFKRTSH